MLKKTIFVLILFLSGAMATAQSAFPVLGGDASNSTGSLSYTVGQIETHHAKNITSNTENISTSLQEGVQQTYTIQDLGVGDGNCISANLFPNPTSNKITIQILSSPKECYFELFSIDGKPLQQSKIEEITTSIDMTSYSTGNYLLRLYGEDCETMYRIIKVNSQSK